MKRMIAAGIVSAFPSFAFASSLDHFSQVYFFGDSFTDGGAAFDLAGPAFVPPEIYPNRQLTNGDTWATKLGGVYVNGTFTQATGLNTTNFAVASAEAVAEADDFAPDLGDQIAAFLSYVTAGLSVGPNALAFVQFGVNDIDEATKADSVVNAAPEDVPAELLKAAIEIGNEVAGAIGNGVHTLLNAGFSKVAVFGLPDLGIFPNVRAAGSDQVAVASAYTQIYNANLIEALQNEFSPGATEYVDSFAIYDTILSNPGEFGITNTSDPCIEDLACLLGDPNTHFFYDNVHQTEVVHDYVAGYISRQFATPIPLPSSVVLLLAGLSGLFVLSRRSAVA